MNGSFKNWVVEQSEQLDPDSKVKLILMLKSEPDAVESFISRNIHAWALTCMSQIPKGHVNFKEDPHKLLQALQKHFAPEMAVINH